MEFDQILNNISRYVLLTKEETDEFCSLLTVRRLKQKEYLLREGEICIYENYVNKGCLRTFSLDKAGTETNFYFAIENWWISDIHSRTYRVPSLCNIVAIEDTEVVQIAQTSLEQFLDKVPKLEHFFRILYQHSIAGHQLRLLQLLRLTAEERYLDFREKYPEFDKRIPQKQIASYLGLTPEFFSTVRTKVLRRS
ncbi:Crp/Fnr family transcriptional regulator [Chitinophaga flava]|uniref:Crp/Fnr family transcriptional regulator n=1 Tax=Chitinophaga flava TaxID=2259036 RepID=A0A365XPP9_9BACT|nr:Crp/Fnr family transcriptional regulator [Chitinophaga flava]RBL88120.1 Crp/Fnr family transcriptional regulator [Chitinophaga flava]